MMRSAMARVARVIVISRARNWLARARLRRVSSASRPREFERWRRLRGPRPTLALRFKTRCSIERHPSRVEEGTPCGATEAESISKTTQLYAPLDQKSRPARALKCALCAGSNERSCLAVLVHRADRGRACGRGAVERGAEGVYAREAGDAPFSGRAADQEAIA